jgi:thymidylate kinase
MARFSGRATRERFEENRDELARIAARYDAAIARLGRDGEVVHVVDGTQSPAQVHVEVVRLASAVLAPRYPAAALSGPARP